MVPGPLSAVMCLLPGMPCRRQVRIAGGRAGRSVIRYCPVAGSRCCSWRRALAFRWPTIGPLRRPGTTAALLSRWQALRCRCVETGGRMGDRTAATQGGHYGVKLVRGPFVRLPAHPQACKDEEAFLSYAARLRAEGAHLAADLFSGGGGLSLGLEAAGYRVILAADKDAEAVETHRHHFGGLGAGLGLERHRPCDEARPAGVGCGRGAAGRRTAVPAVLQSRPQQDPPPRP